MCFLHRNGVATKNVRRFSQELEDEADPSKKIVGIKLEYSGDQHMFTGLTSNPMGFGKILEAIPACHKGYTVDGSAVVDAFEPNEAALKHAF